MERGFMGNNWVGLRELGGMEGQTDEPLMSLILRKRQSHKREITPSKSAKIQIVKESFGCAKFISILHYRGRINDGIDKFKRTCQLARIDRFK